MIATRRTIAGLYPGEAGHPPSEAGSFTSSDGSVHFTARELADLIAAAYTLPTVRHHIHELAESPQLADVDPRDRTKAAYDHIMQWHNKHVSKPSKVSKDVEEHDNAEHE